MDSNMQAIVASWPDHWARDHHDAPSFQAWLAFMRSNDYAPSEFLDALEAALTQEEGREGSVRVPDDEEVVCRTCDGIGEVMAFAAYMNGDTDSIPCPECISREHAERAASPISDGQVGNIVEWYAKRLTWDELHSKLIVEEKMAADPLLDRESRAFAKTTADQVGAAIALRTSPISEGQENG